MAPVLVHFSSVWRRSRLKMVSWESTRCPTHLSTATYPRSFRHSRSNEPYCNALKLQAQLQLRSMPCRHTSRAGISARKEASLGLSIGSNTTLLPVDLLVYNWTNVKDTCFDITGVSPFTSDIRYFSPDQAIAKVFLRKHNKYLATCEAHGYELGILAFTTLGELGEDTTIFLKRLKYILAKNDASGTGNFLFHRVGIAIQKSVGA
ncbi:uncharacterized protein LOC113353787 [Papaver somniferum]|uniref:uncharacterized protein LOC113353787 n=1 Tax=Papaver somniferum TaxID=3469 RepID=UPI000E6F9A56|nr:uncharacterized protein LOC113353787 [Papaver somniferum]XP_026453070.1 uncharacterized protein LOC113353787 [Papaver somniferum]